MRVNVRFERHSSRTRAWLSSTLSLQNENFGNSPTWIIRRHDCLPYSYSLISIPFSPFLFFACSGNVDEAAVSKFNSLN